MVINNKETRHEVNAVFRRRVAAHDEGIKHDTQRFLRQARPVVADSKKDFGLGVIFSQFRRQRDAAACRQAGQFVFQQKFEKPANLRLVRLQCRQRIGNLVVNLDAPRGELILERFEGRADGFVDEHLVGELKRRRSGCRPQILEQSVDFFDL